MLALFCGVIVVGSASCVGSGQCKKEVNAIKEGCTINLVRLSRTEGVSVDALLNIEANHVCAIRITGADLIFHHYEETLQSPASSYSVELPLDMLSNTTNYLLILPETSSVHQPSGFVKGHQLYYNLNYDLDASLPRIILKPDEADDTLYGYIEFTIDILRVDNAREWKSTNFIGRTNVMKMSID